MKISTKWSFPRKRENGAFGGKHLEENVAGHILDAALSDVGSVSELPGSGWGCGLVHHCPENA